MTRNASDLTDALDRALAEVAGRTSEPPEIGPRLTGAALDVRPVRTRLPVRELVLLAVVSLLYTAGLLMALRFRRDLSYLPAWWLVVYLLAWMAGFSSILYLAVVPRRGAVVPRGHLAGMLGAIACLFFTTGGLLFARHHLPQSIVPEATVENFVRNSHYCLRVGLLTALVPVALATWFLRRVFPIGPRWAGVAIGAGSGSLGGLLLHLHCPIADRFHLGLVHGGVVLVTALLCALLLPRLIRP